MRLTGAVRVKRSTLVVAAILSLFAISFLLVGRLDIVLLQDDAVKPANGDMCGCGVADYGPSEGQRSGNGADDGKSITHRIHHAGFVNEVCSETFLNVDNVISH
jgi:hypothetical protein